VFGGSSKPPQKETSMTPAGQRVLRGWSRLSPADQEEVAQEIERIRRLPDFQRREQLEKTRSVAPGPLGSVCECCGR
jgi:hypothetical protein